MRAENSGYDIYASGLGPPRAFLDLDWPLDPAVSPVDRERMAAHHAVAAIIELSRGLFIPLRVEASRCVTNNVDGVWMVADRSEPDDHVRVNAAGSVLVPTSSAPVGVDGHAMTTMLDDLLTTSGEASELRWLGWSEIRVDDTLAALPTALVPTGDEFILDDLDNRVRGLGIPARRRSDGVWVGRYDLGFWTPISVTVLREAHVSGISDADGHHTLLMLSIDVHWSVWWRDGSPGRAMLDAALHRLHDLGWHHNY
ncbi:hypothetical protein [Nocardia ignorata]|nr:hypothetical protein [Nocardia ignorata]